MADIIAVLSIITIGFMFAALFTWLVYRIATRPETHAQQLALTTAASTYPAKRLVYDQQETLRGLQQQMATFVDQLDAQVAALARPDILTGDEAAVVGTQIQQLLDEESRLMTEIQALTDDRRLSTRAQHRILEKHLLRNEDVLERLKQTLSTEPVYAAPAENAVSEAVQTDMTQQQYAAIMGQLDQLAKLVQQQSTTIPPAQTLSETEAAMVTESVKIDRLTDIKGVGPVFAGLLHEAGVHTFESLAAQDAETLRKAIDLPIWRQDDVVDWISQAQVIADNAEASA